MRLRLPSRFLTVLPLLLAAGTLVAEVPQVLFLGDSVQRQAVSAAAGELRDEVKLVIPRSTANDTGTALEQLDALLGDGDWDLVYFTFGLGDLTYKDPRTGEIRALSKYSGGVRVTSPEQYEKNLDELVRRLKATGAKLLWASTTPVVEVNTFPGYAGNLYDAGSAADYNAIAAKVMKRHNVPVNDIHAWVLAQFGPDDKHPGFTGYDKALAKMKKPPLHTPVVEAIRQTLGL